MLMFICTELYSGMFSNLTIIKVLILLLPVEAYILMPWRMLGTRSSGEVWLYPDRLILSLSCSRTHRIRFLSVQVTIIHGFFCVSDKKNLVDWYDQNWCYFSNLRQKKYSLKFSTQEQIKAATLATTIPGLSFFKTIALNRKLTTVVIFSAPGDIIQLKIIPYELQFIKPIPVMMVIQLLHKKRKFHL